MQLQMVVESIKKRSSVLVVTGGRPFLGKREHWPVS
jgi:hypothetical protein